MTRRNRIERRFVAAAFALLLGGCGPGASQPASSGAEAGAEGGGIGGSYHVSGVTIDAASGEQRQIAGRVRVDPEGDRYTAHFELETLFPGSQAAAAKVIGTGSGTIEGRTLRGSAATQLLSSHVPGVDVGFAMVPRDVGARIVSSSVAEFFADGSVRIEIQNQPAEGEDYAPTRTVLVGYPLESR